ncbi:threonine/homoserine/homoserine lactone efflux protein [Sphingomonas vulcanisoli]|uniref:Threonine/homoserine/homoserine lactone efflux protein n=1 Tax=Sphingomonas vulcanisoli TaxID=1658060 RepID=A0ABX0TU14_9SPHN|nr:LysE family translocator [Sphingomonas vulcanisoli]NIJ07270.1 threonine/homoserine/homoserine lactone efflux protein [Sphingomonas vulcanisoli]
MTTIGHQLFVLATIALVYLMAVASPGPNFFLATRLALAGQRRLGLRVALGIASGSAIWATLSMVGVATILGNATWLQLGIRIFAAAYLLWFGFKLIRSALIGTTGSSPVDRLPTSGKDAYIAGITTCLTNPKAAAFWTSIFGAMFPVHAPLWMYPAVVGIVFTICGGWYVGVACLLSTERVQRRYFRIQRPVDGVLGAILIGFSAHLAFSG